MKHWLIILLLLAFSPASGTEFTALRAQQSSITFVSKQMGVRVEGGFRKFDASLAIDPAKPETGTARIDIDLASIDTGNSDADQEAMGKDWFDTKNHPVASFVSSQVRSLDKGRYEASGQMTIKGKTRTVRAPFTLTQQGGMLRIEGMFPLKRLDYGIGSGIWGDTETVADEVQIRFSLAVAPK